jgi:hypothetical protein
MSDKVNFATGDRELLKAAVSGDGLVEVTPALMADIQESIKARRAEIDSTYQKLVDDCPYETRLAIAAWVMRAIVDHARDGGSFRFLIYDRLGFGPDAYLPLYYAGGMTISNEFVLPTEKQDAK